MGILKWILDTSRRTSGLSVGLAKSIKAYKVPVGYILKIILGLMLSFTIIEQAQAACPDPSDGYQLIKENNSPEERAELVPIKIQFLFWRAISIPVMHASHAYLYREVLAIE